MVKREKKDGCLQHQINVDVNGSLNIYIKYILKVANDVPKEPVGTGLVMNPIKINLRTENSIEFLSSLMKSL